LEGAYRADQISIGVPDPRLVPWIQGALRARQVPNRYGPGRAIRETRVGRLLQAVADLLQQDDFRAQAALARHVDITQWLARKGTPPNWESELDCYHAAYLPAYRLSPDAVRLENKPELRVAIGRLEQLMRPLRGEPRKLHRWATPLAEWLAQVYGGESAERHEPVARALQCVGQSLAELNQVPDALAPSVTAAQALRIVLRQMAGASIPAPSDVAAVELLGWLELPLDAAPAMVVTGMNEGTVPQAVNGDLFLPDRLRRQLGIEDNRRRYARDAYALQMILHGRANVQLISARRDSQGNPLWMSRLLGACQPEEMAQRCLRFWSEEEAVARPISRRASTNTSKGLRIPRPNRLGLLPEPLPITDLSAYLRCPYRFYLQRLLKLSAVCDDRLELDRSGFGTLAHDILCAFGKSDVKDLSSVDQLRTSLREILDQVVRERFDERPLAATCVQIEQLWERLKAFAEKQAQWRDQGWRIEQVEVMGQDVCAPWEVDGQPVRLTGRIDRIDVHEDTGERILWDYKTSDDGDSPDKTHRKKNEWVDLQLPLYRHLCQPVNVERPVGLGYIALPKKVDKVEFQRASWSADDLAAADQQAMEVVRNIRRKLFWPPHEDSLKLKDALAAIYQAGVLDRNDFSAEPLA
jgi:RecB family exonuclease